MAVPSDPSRNVQRFNRRSGYSGRFMQQRFYTEIEPFLEQFEAAVGSTFRWDTMIMNAEICLFCEEIMLLCFWRQIVSLYAPVYRVTPFTATFESFITADLLHWTMRYHTTSYHTITSILRHTYISTSRLESIFPTYLPLSLPLPHSIPHLSIPLQDVRYQ